MPVVGSDSLEKTQMYLAVGAVLGGVGTCMFRTLSVLTVRTMGACVEDHGYTC